MYGINLNPVLPVRAEASERAEMVTEILFGEFFSILRVAEKWLFIQNKSDNYEGWVDKKMITRIEENEFNFLASGTPLQIFKPVAQCLIHNKNESIVLPAGSLIHFYNNEENVSNLLGNAYSIPSDALMKRGQQPASGHLITTIAKSFLNTPYRWGGKNILGIDCSGLVQMCFSICGIQLPRDASQQVQLGESVDFLQEAQTGDLAFFENEEGNIIHVGILLDESTIIHASGKVRIDKIDTMGIKSSDDGRYTHQLRIIKRIHTI